MNKVGWVMTALFALFMLGGSAAPKLLGASVAQEPMAQIGWPTEPLLLIGLIELVGTLLFVLPRTGFLGAVGLTALLGGAIASHWRAGSPLVSHTLFGVYLGVFMWAALWLREPAVRALFPFLQNRSQ